jgi:hypothetical protein
MPSHKSPPLEMHKIQQIIEKCKLLEKNLSERRIAVFYSGMFTKRVPCYKAWTYIKMIMFAGIIAITLLLCTLSVVLKDPTIPRGSKRIDICYQ